MMLSVIQAISAEALRLDAVEPGDDFFELGGHSRMAATVVGRLNQRLGFALRLG
jgi:hypothetical protein